MHLFSLGYKMKVVQNVIMIVDSRQQQSFFKEVNGDDNVENGKMSTKMSMVNSETDSQIIF